MYFWTHSPFLSFINFSFFLSLWCFLWWRCLFRSGDRDLLLLRCFLFLGSRILCFFVDPIIRKRMLQLTINKRTQYALTHPTSSSHLVVFYHRLTITATTGQHAGTVYPPRLALVEVHSVLHRLYMLPPFCEQTNSGWFELDLEIICNIFKMSEHIWMPIGGRENFCVFFKLVLVL